MSRAKSVVLACCVGWLLLPAACVQAQDVFRDDEHLAGDRPEAWAMQRATAVTLMTSFGPVPALAPGQWQGALELGHIPGLSTDEQRVGFRGDPTLAPTVIRRTEPSPIRPAETTRSDGAVGMNRPRG